MTGLRSSRTLHRTAVVCVAAIVTALLALAMLAPRVAMATSRILPRPSGARPGARAMVHLSVVSLRGTEPAGDSLKSPILVFATGAASVGIGTSTPSPLSGTLRLYRLPAMTADVTDGEVHLQLTGPGRISVAGDVTGGAATKVSADGRHIVLMKGGVGIKSRW